MRKILCALALLTMAAPARTHAQDPVELELALALARTTLNEASFSASPADLYLTWQIVEGHGATSAERLTWLKAHSSCVNGTRELEPREARSNCRWTRGLSPDDKQPIGWPSALRWEGWRSRLWAHTYTVALALVRGRRYPPPCVETPDTWGGSMDHARALARGMRPVACTGTVNTGFLYAAR